MSKHKKTAKPKKKRDVAEIARSVVEQAIGEKLTGEPLDEQPPDTRNPAAVALSRLGASKGGKARAVKLSKERRSTIARDAANVRWNHKKESE